MFQSRILDEINNSVVVTDLKGDIEYVNEGAVKLLGYSKDVLIGSNVMLFGSDPAGLSQKQVIKEVLSKGHFSGELINFDKAGNRHVLMSHIWLLKEDSSTKKLVGVSTDITEQKTI
jgi:PAS domain S-box-containing protein